MMVTVLKFLQTLFITNKREALSTFSLLNRLGLGILFVVLFYWVFVVVVLL